MLTVVPPKIFGRWPNAKIRKYEEIYWGKARPQYYWHQEVGYDFSETDIARSERNQEPVTSTALVTCLPAISFLFKQPRFRGTSWPK